MWGGQRKAVGRWIKTTGTRAVVGVLVGSSGPQLFWDGSQFKGNCTLLREIRADIRVKCRRWKRESGRASFLKTSKVGQKWFQSSRSPRVLQVLQRVRHHQARVFYLLRGRAGGSVRKPPACKARGGRGNSRRRKLHPSTATAPQQARTQPANGAWRSISQVTGIFFFANRQ